VGEWRPFTPRALGFVLHRISFWSTVIGTRVAMQALIMQEVELLDELYDKLFHGIEEKGGRNQ
jgi:hypothetical protein